MKIRSNRVAYNRHQIDSSISDFLSFVFEGAESVQVADPINTVSTVGSRSKLKPLVEEYFEENIRSNR